MITFEDQKSTPQADGSTLLTFTVRVPSADVTGGAGEAERSLQAALHTAEQRIMEHAIARHDKDGEPLEQGKKPCRGTP